MATYHFSTLARLWPRRTRPATIAAIIGLMAGPGGAKALDVLANEKAGRDACAKRLCDMVLKREPKGPPLACDMTKTWDRGKIKKNGEKSNISWGFGDARCQVALNIDRAILLPAVASPAHTVFIPEQTVRCKIEDSENKLTDLNVRAAPKIKFKDGKAHKVWINVKDVDGDSNIGGLVWSVAKLADGLGIFHKATLKEINKFIHEKCAADYGGEVAKAGGKTGAEAKKPGTKAAEPDKDVDKAKATGAIKAEAK